MKSLRILFASLAFALMPIASATAQEVLVVCKLDDPKSASFCKTDPRMAIACQRSYRFNESKRLIEEVNPGRSVPPFVVEDWSETSISLKREMETTDPKVREVVRTRFERIDGRLLEYSSYLWAASGVALTNEELNYFEAEQVRIASLFGYLNRVPITAECKPAKAVF